jgi:hypothetical protein
LLIDLGQDPAALKKAINDGFAQARGAAAGALEQVGVVIPPDAFKDVNLGGEIEQRKQDARDIAAQKNLILDANRNTLVQNTNEILTRMEGKLQELINNFGGGAAAAGALRGDNNVENDFRAEFGLPPVGAPNDFRPNAGLPPAGAPLIIEDPIGDIVIPAEAVEEIAAGAGFQNIEPGKVRKSPAAINRGEQIKALTGGNVNRFKTLKEEEKVLEERLASERKSADEARANQAEINKRNQNRVEFHKRFLKADQELLDASKITLENFDRKRVGLPALDADTSAGFQRADSVTDRRSLVRDVEGMEEVVAKQKQTLRQAEQNLLDDFLRPDEEKAEAKLAEMAAQRKAKLDASPEARAMLDRGISENEAGARVRVLDSEIAKLEDDLRTASAEEDSAFERSKDLAKRGASTGFSGYEQAREKREGIQQQIKEKNEELSAAKSLADRTRVPLPMPTTPDYVEPIRKTPTELMLENEAREIDRVRGTGERPDRPGMLHRSKTRYKTFAGLGVGFGIRQGDSDRFGGKTEDQRLMAGMSEEIERRRQAKIAADKAAAEEDLRRRREAAIAAGKGPQGTGPKARGNAFVPSPTLDERRNRLEQYQTTGQARSGFAGLLRAGSNAASTQKARGVLSNINQQIAKIEAARERGGGTLDPRVQARLDLLKQRRTGLMGIQGVGYAPDPVAGGGVAGGGQADVDAIIGVGPAGGPAGGAAGGGITPEQRAAITATSHYLPEGALKPKVPTGAAGGGYTPVPMPRPAINTGNTYLDNLVNGTAGGAAGIGATPERYPNLTVRPSAAGGAAGGGGVAGPDVAMQNLANALNGIRDGINLNIGEVNVTITNTGELANSIKQAVIEAIGGGVNDNSLTTNETSLLNTTSTA